MRIRFQLITFMFLRAILNTAHRMVYPFLPIFARGLGVDISTMSLLMTGRSLLGAGDDCVLVIAGVSVEIGLVQCAVSWRKALWNKISSKVRVEAQNFYRTDLSNANVIFKKN